MKNKDEFRRMVWEKAARYEEQRKIRRKKLRETILLCSICLFITVSVYFSVFLIPANAEDPSKNESYYGDTVGSSDETGSPSISEGDASDTAAFTETTGTATETFVTTGPLETTVSTTNVQTTDIQTTDIQKTEQSTKPPTPPEFSFRLDRSFTNTHIRHETETPQKEAVIIDSLSELAAYLNKLRDQYNVPEFDIDSITDYHDDYFEDHTLVAVAIKDTCSYRFDSSRSRDLTGGSLSLVFCADSEQVVSETISSHFFITVDKGDYDKIEILTEP